MRLVSALLALSLLAACGGSDTPPSQPSPPTTHDGDSTELPDGPPAPEPNERPQMTAEECEAVGTVVGDIGDGAIHRPDYTCPNGEQPIGTVPLGIEGSVCCPG